MKKFVRKVDELGRIVLPAEIRRHMGWDETTLVEFLMNTARNELVIKKCGDTLEVIR